MKPSCPRAWRQPALWLLAVLLSAVVLPATANAEVVVTDLRGRTVTLAAPASRLLIDDARFLVALALIHPQPERLIAAWAHDSHRIDGEMYANFKARHPALATAPRVASSAGAFSLEQVLDVRPDVAVFSLGRGPTDQQLELIGSAGIPVVFIDFFVQPFENQEKSLAVLGRLVGREAEAAKFAAYRRERLDRISARVAQAAGQRPKVFMEAHAGMSAECCNSPGKGNVGDYIEFVGGHNIGADVLPGATGRLNVEYVIGQRPAVYVATGGPHLEKSGGLVMGPYSPERVRKALVAMTSRPVLARLPAVQNHRAYGLSHQLLNSPLDLLAVEALARWIRPDLFGDLDPARTLAELNTRFLAVPVDGVHWIALE